MKNEVKMAIIENYRNLFSKYSGNSPEAVQMSSEGQRFRFEKLTEIANLKGLRVLDLGCGTGDMYPFLMNRFGDIDYTGIDITPDSVAYATEKYPHARFLCCDILNEDIDEIFDYVLLSAVFNNAIPNSTEFLEELITVAFRHCSLGLGFNFISKFVNITDSQLAYHNPVEIFDFCLRELTHNVIVHHHYERCDVVVFAYR